MMKLGSNIQVSLLLIVFTVFVIILTNMSESNAEPLDHKAVAYHKMILQKMQNEYVIAEQKFWEKRESNKEWRAGYNAWFYNQRTDNGERVPNAFANAVEKIKTLQILDPFKKQISILPSPPSLSGFPTIDGTWNSVGPTPTTCIFGGLCSGRVSALAVDPVITSTVYAGAAQGGVWKSINSGVNWIPLSDDQQSSAIGSIAVDPTGIVYVGTGEGNSSCDSYYGAGILKSADGGINWTTLGAATFGSSTINKIVIDPTSPNILLAATGLGNTGSATSACQIVLEGITNIGVYRSTDSGATWSLVLFNGAGVRDLVMDPDNPQILYAGVNNVGVYKSIDGGVTWNLLNNSPVPFRHNYLGISNSTLFSMVYAPNDAGAASLSKSTDGGNNWSGIPLPIDTFGGFCKPQCWYDAFIYPHPTNPNILYIGGYDFYRSTDSGSSWTNLGGYSGNTHPDQQSFAFNPQDPEEIYLGNDGGIWKSNTASTCSVGGCLTNLNEDLGITQFQTIATHPTDPNKFAGGTQDNGSIEHNGVSTLWVELQSGDGGWIAYDPQSPATMYHTFFQIDIVRSDDEGVSWVAKTTGINTLEPSQFYIPVALDNTNPSTLYLGATNLYKTTNRGDLWAQTSLSGNLGLFSAIHVAPSNSTFVYAGTSLGEFYASTDTGLTFTNLSVGLPSKYMTDIAVDPQSPQKVYITFSNFGGSHVFTSSDSGNNWTDITSNLPDTPTTSILVKNGVLYLGTDIGPFISLDNGTTWNVYGTNFPTVSIFDLAMTSDDNLLAASHGRGVFSIPEFTPSTCSPPSLGDWIITISCTMTQNEVLNGNLIVQNNAVLTIPNGAALNIDFVNFNLTVEIGSGILIELGGVIT